MKSAHVLICGAIAAVFCLAAAQPARAWEADVHYGLVKWLAVQAGFTIEDAETIAAGSEAPDEAGSLSAFDSTLYQICNPLGSSTEVISRLVQRVHFPSGGPVPGAPRLRPVMPGSFEDANAGNRWVRQEIEVPWNPAETARQTMLDSLGNALHALADSWSHRGIPGNPWPWLCPEPITWAHPDARGGPWHHYADITYRYPADAHDTAETIYRFLVRFLRINAAEFHAAPRRPFADLEAGLDAFTQARTMRAKHDWFRSQDGVMPYERFTTYPCFLRSINLPYPWGEYTPCADDATRQPRFEAQVAAAPAAVEERPVRGFVDEVLRTWVVARDYATVAAEFLDMQSVRGALLGDRVGMVADRYGAGWDTTLLSMWLVADHGSVSEFGHGLPDSDGLVPLVKQIPDLAKVEAFENIDQAISSASGTAPYDLAPLTVGTDYVVSFRFRHIARDTLALRAVRRDEGWRITVLDWATD